MLGTEETWNIFVTCNKIQNDLIKRFKFQHNQPELNRYPVKTSDSIDFRTIILPCQSADEMKR